MPGKASTPDAEDGWPKPSVGVDAVALTVEGGKLQVLVHRRHNEPSAGELSIPGTFLKHDEQPEDAARRALHEKGCLGASHRMELVSVENYPHSPSQDWVIIVVYMTVVPWWEMAEATAEGSGVRLLDVIVPWAGNQGGPIRLRTPAGDDAELAFAHELLVGKAVAWLRDELWRSDFCLGLVRDQFTLRQLLDVYEAILGEELYRTSFRRRIAEGQNRMIEPTGRVLDSDPRKPELFRRLSPAK